MTTPENNGDMKETLEPLYRQMADAFDAQDSSGILNLLMPDYLSKMGAQVLVPEQVRAGIIHDMSRPRPAPQSLRFAIEEASAEGDGRATATITVTQTRGSEVQTLRRADAWVRTPLGWRLQVSLTL